MKDAIRYEFWFATGSQDLYGPETLAKVEEDSRAVVAGLADALPYKLVHKPTLLDSAGILAFARAANADPACAGVITWMHTFSPSKMWIAGLSELRRPLCHLHTQFNRDIPWNGIDMDFMNLNQSAHGDREHGYIGARMRLPRKVVVGHWREPAVTDGLSGWMRAAAAFAEGKRLKVLRFGDNMRDVAVTEGDKVEAQLRFGWSVDGWGLGSLAEACKAVPERDVDALAASFRDLYVMGPGSLEGAGAARVREQARIELGLRTMLEREGAGAFTTTFQDLAGLPQLPGLAVQRLMADGYGFGAEGDWKTAAFLRCVKVMTAGLEGGTSFMEDYTYHLAPGSEAVLGAHMLEVCPSIAAAKPRLEVHPLSIGGADDPARLVFSGKPGPALNATIVDMGERFRMIINEVDAVEAPADMPRLPVARVLWRPRPDLRKAAESWIIAGGAHHTVYSAAAKTEWLEDWARMAETECVLIDGESRPERIRKELFWNDAAYRLAR